MSEKSKTNRRDFLKTSGVLAAGAATLSVARGAHAQGSDQIQLCLIGCGGRGQGCIEDRLQVGDNAKLVAISDAFDYRTNNAANKFRGDNFKFKNQVDLPDDRIFSGLDAYKKAIDCLKPGDQVIVATMPGFRPQHYKYAIEKGCHIFMEKPLCTDAPGFRSLMETNKLADEKGLKVGVGLQRRYEPHYYNWIDKIAEGALGDIQYSRVFWNGDTPWCRQRNPNQTELQFQLDNWYHFIWLCGDNICEQHVHNLDIGLWIHGKGDKMAHPVEANAMGGRQEQALPFNLLKEAPPFEDRDEWFKWYNDKKGAIRRMGQAWDHYFIEYKFSDGSHMYSQCRHIPRCWGHVAEYAYGTNGYGQPGWINDNAGKTVWRNEEKAKKGPYQWEHDVLVDCIRNDKPRNDGWYGAHASMAAVLGRMAAQSGQLIKWDDAVKNGKAEMPVDGVWDWNDKAPVNPDANGFYEGSVARAGVFKWNA